MTVRSQGFLMESPVNGDESLSEVQNSVSAAEDRDPPSTSETPRPSRPPLRATSRNQVASSTSYLTGHPNYEMKIHQKHPYVEANHAQHQELPKQYHNPNGKSGEALTGKNITTLGTKICDSNGMLASSKGAVDQTKSYAQSEITFCSSPQNSFYSATNYSEAKQSFTNTEVSECVSAADKSGESGEVTNSCDFNESRKTSICRGSTGSDVSDESSTSSLSSAMYKPHKANDIRWEAIQAVRARDGMLEMRHFRLLKKLGCGDIGSVHLAELSGTRTCFAMKIMNKTELASRKKLLRAQTEREILQSLDHPFLPTLYTHFETETFSCLVMEFCPGGDLHALRQRQPRKYFSEHAARLAFLFTRLPCTFSTWRLMDH